MNWERQAFIREKARDLQVELWRRRSEVAPGVHRVEDLLPFSPRLWAEGVLELQFEEPQEIPSILGLDSWATLEIEIAGYLDRQHRTIAVAQRFKPEWRRFTGAHEVGHWCLHDGLIHHRDRPVTGGERANRKRSSLEQEADIFAAELLMPPKLVRRLFLERFGHPLDGRRPDNSLAAWLSAGTGDSIKPSELADRGPMFRALLVSRTNLLGENYFVPLYQTFGVSLTAMAIQLLDLHLVQ